MEPTATLSHDRCALLLKMASATVTDLPSNYCKEELDLILPEVGSLEKEDLNESDVEIEGDDKEEEESDSDDDTPLSVFITT